MKLFFYSIVIFICISCDSAVKPIVFKNMVETEIQDMTMHNVTIDSKLNFHNPNIVGVNLVRTDVNVIVNEIDVGKLNLLNAVSVDANSDFQLPVTISFKPKEIVKKKGAIQSALKLYASKKVNVHYLGKVTFKIAGIEIDYPVDFKEEVPLKLKE